MKRRFEPFGDGVVTLRMLEARDLDATVEWRNRDEVRRWFKTSSRIEPHGHSAWFCGYSLKEDDFVFIVEVGGRPVGQVAVYDINLEHARGEVGRFVVDQGHAGRGYMARACRLLVAFCAASLGLRELTLEVREDNVRAIILYRALGFVDSGSDGPFMRMRLSIGIPTPDASSRGPTRVTSTSA